MALNLFLKVVTSLSSDLFNTLNSDFAIERDSIINHLFQLMFKLRTRVFVFSQQLGLLKSPKRSIPKLHSRISISPFTTSHKLKMPLKKGATTGKRKASIPQESSASGASSKKAKLDNGSSDPLLEPHPTAQEAEDNGIVLRKYYPYEMSNARALAYNNNKLVRPIELLNTALSETKTEREKIPVKNAVVHWFKCDLRTKDNNSLHLASEKAKEKGVPLIGMYIVSPQDFEAHLTAPVRVDFILRTL
jgi:hypothetical protein